MNILVSGSNNGLGKFLTEELKATGFDKGQLPDILKSAKNIEFDLIIHCAFNSAREINSGNLAGYFDDNLLLTQNLCQLPHKKFLYISSIDVYPKNGSAHSEDELININEISGTYGLFKLISESIINKQSNNCLILRCASLLGKYSRENNLIKIINSSNKCKLSLTADSRLRFVLYSDLLYFIKAAIKNDYCGIYNIASKDSLALSEISQALRKEVDYGPFHYDAGKIDTTRVKAVFSGFNRSALEIIENFTKETGCG